MTIRIHDLSKSYGSLAVLQHLNLELQEEESYCLMGASGSGKTTLLRILLELEQPDSGNVTGLSALHTTAVFQEDRLCESFSPLENVLMVTDKSMSTPAVRTELCRLLPEESLTRPVHTLSGGMKRRTAILRALLAPSDAVFMDEPFTGLDEQTKQTVIDYIKEKTTGKLLLISTHQEEDVALLNGTLITLDKEIS